MLYLLFRKDRKGVFKIGVSIDIPKRFENIGACSSVIDFKKSLVVVSKSYTHLERILHNGFAEYRVDSFNESGGSEWFRSECFQEIVKFLGDNYKILCIDSIGSIPKTNIKIIKKPKHKRKREPSELVLIFNDLGWLDATSASSSKCKVVSEWLRLPNTKRFVEGLREIFTNTIKSGRGNGGCTWIHPVLVPKFIEWVDFEYSVKHHTC